MTKSLVLPRYRIQGFQGLLQHHTHIELGIISEKFDPMNNKLGMISEKFGRMYNKLGTISEKFDWMYNKLGMISEKFD